MNLTDRELIIGHLEDIESDIKFDIEHRSTMPDIGFAISFTVFVDRLLKDCYKWLELSKDKQRSGKFNG